MRHVFSARKHSEIDSLKRAVESLMTTNSEKDQHIEDMKRLMSRYRRIEDLIYNAQRDGKTALELYDIPDNFSDTSSTQNSVTSSCVTDPTMREPHTPDSLDGLEPYQRPIMPYPSATSTPGRMFADDAYMSRVNGGGDAHDLSTPSSINNHSPSSTSAEDVPHSLNKSPSAVQRKGQSFGMLPRDASSSTSSHPVHSLPPPSPRKPFTLTQSLNRHKYTSNYRYTNPQQYSDINEDAYSANSYDTSASGVAAAAFTSSAAYSATKGVQHSNTMPRSFGYTGGNGNKGSAAAHYSTLSREPSDVTLAPITHAGSDVAVSQHQQQQQQQQPGKKSRGFLSSFGKGFFKMRSGKWSSSAPNLAQTEQDEEALKDRMAQEYKQLQAHNVDAQQKQKKKSIKTFFGKLKRSNSQELDDQAGEFRRGGVRSTASGRIGTGWSGSAQTDFDVPFARWDSDRVSTWLHNIGLSMYVGTCKRWVRNGEQLLRASAHDLEKELHMKNPLHRKKLQLALKSITEDSYRSDHIHRLDHNWVTRWMDDIGLPHYKDAFHDAMVDGRMLNCLSVDDLVYLKVSNALHHFSIKCGIQVLRLNQFNPDCIKRRPLPDEPSPIGAPNEVMLWSNHRVMEWLRSIDLSEYAPNLRGSGVHGGLMVLEPHFTAELLASLLSIPANKTLLRRHLNTHFVSLVGSATQQTKRENEQKVGYIPLTPSQKIKVKKGIFGHRRTRSQSEADYLCPLESSSSSSPSSSSPATNGSSSSSSRTNGTPNWNSSRSGTLDSRKGGTLDSRKGGTLDSRKGGTLDRKNDKKTATTTTTTTEIGAFNVEINSLTNMLDKEQYLSDDGLPTSNV